MQQLVKLTALQQLELRRIDMGTDAAEAMAESMSQHLTSLTSLRKLGVPTNRLGWKGAAALLSLITA